MFWFFNLIACILGILICAAFLLIRSPRIFLLVACATTLCSTVLISFHNTECSNVLLLFSGGILLSVGFAFVRLMLIRSVSLNALSSIAASSRLSEKDNPEAQLSKDIVSRCEDMQHYGLAQKNRDRLGLTRWGLFIAYLAHVCMRLCRIEESCS